MQLLPLIALLSTVAWAAPITYGTIDYPYAYEIIRFGFGGSGFNVGAHAYGYIQTHNYVDYAPGATWAPNIWANDFGWRTGSVRIGDTLDPEVNWNPGDHPGKSLLQTLATPVTFTGPGTFYGSFTFTGDLCGHSASTFNGDCVYVLPSMTGSGLYSVSVALSQPNSGSSSLKVSNVTMTFGTPETATFWSLASGLLLLGALRSTAIKRTKR